MKRFLFLIAMALAHGAWAASPNVTVTTAQFCEDCSYSGISIRLVPTAADGATPRYTNTPANGVVTFASVLPGYYTLTVDVTPPQSISILVPDTSGTLGATNLIFGAWGNRPFTVPSISPDGVIRNYTIKHGTITNTTVKAASVRVGDSTAYLSLGSGTMEFSTGTHIEDLGGNVLQIDGVSVRTNLAVGGNVAIVGSVAATNGVSVLSTNGIILGPSGAQITNILSGSASLDFPSTLTLTNSDLSITVTGTTTNDVPTLCAPFQAVQNGGWYSCYPSNDTVWVRFNNYTANSINPAAHNFRVLVTKF